jgi:hypothetical protein
MDLLKLSTDWAKAEVFSAKIVWLFSIITLLTAAGFFYWGKTAMARAFVWPMLIAGILLVAVGAGLFFTNRPRIAQFEQLYQANPQAFMQQELQRTAKSQGELSLVFRILPALLILAAMLILLAPSPAWRSIAITLALFATVLMAIDSHTDARNTMYHAQLKKMVDEPGENHSK